MKNQSNSNLYDFWFEQGLKLSDSNLYDQALFAYDQVLEIKPDCSVAWYNRGIILGKLQKHEEAILSYDKALAITSNYCEAWVNRGIVLSNLQKYEEALFSYNQALRSNCNFYRAWYNKANLLRELKRYEEAIFSYEKVIKIKPDCYKAWLYKGITLDGLGKNREAIDSYSGALKIKPKSYEAWFNKGRAYQILKQYEKSIISYSKSLKIKPSCYQSWYQLGNVFSDLQLYQQALNSYNKALKINSISYEIWANKGDVLTYLKLDNEAIESYKKATTINPNFYNAWKCLGDAFSRLRKIQEAISCYDKALGVNQNYEVALYKKGSCLLYLNKYEEAIANFDKALSIQPNNYIYWVFKAQALIELGRLKEAIASYDTAIALEPNDGSVWLMRSSPLMKLNNWEEALYSLEKAITLEPNSSQFYSMALLKKGSILRCLKCYKEGIKVLDGYININSNDYEAWFEKAECLYGLELSPQALKCIDKAIALNSESSKCWTTKGYILNSLKSYNKALECLEKAIDLNLYNHGAWNGKGRSILFLESNHIEALDCFIKATELYPNYAEAWAFQGNILSMFLRRYEEAIKCFDKAIEIDSNYDRALDGKGFTLMYLGHYEDALYCLNKTLEINPNYASAWVNKGALLGILGKWEETLICCEKGTEIEPEYFLGWANRGNALLSLNRYQEAIVSIDRALDIKLDCYQAWIARASIILNLVNYDKSSIFSLSAIAKKKPELNQTGYRGALSNLKEGLKYCNKENQPEGYGQFHRVIGLFHYDEATKRHNSYKYYQLAKDEYHQALKILTVKDFPEIHLEILQDLIRVYLVLGETEQAKELQRRGTDIYKLLSNGCSSPKKQQQLAVKFATFQQLTVDLAIESGDSAQALELAEQGKNACLSWLLYGLDEEIGFSPWEKIGNIPNNNTAVLYWHLSPVSLQTFILKHDSLEPIVINSSLEQHRKTYIESLNSLKLFENWVDNWNQKYDEYRSKGKERQQIRTGASWRAEMPQQLTSLRNILSIQEIEKHLTGIEQLILVPHRDLHRFPLHALFSEKFEITYLPSLQMGLSLQKIQPDETATPSLLSVEAPNSEGLSPLNFAILESGTICKFFSDSKRLQGDVATKERVATELGNSYNALHFAGHGLYNFHDPKSSELALSGTDRLTLAEIRQQNLSHYQLVTLSACETAITGNQTITTEYVGLVSGFLSVGVSHVVSTLWTVESAASALVMIEFYRRWKAGIPKAKALAETTHWLRNLTVSELKEWYKDLLNQLSPDDKKIKPFIKTELRKLNKIEQDKKLYEHPYYWAAFIITGNI